MEETGTCPWIKVKPDERWRLLNRQPITEHTEEDGTPYLLGHPATFYQVRRQFNEELDAKLIAGIYQPATKDAEGKQLTPARIAVRNPGEPISKQEKRVKRSHMVDGTWKYWGVWARFYKDDNDNV